MKIRGLRVAVRQHVLKAVSRLDPIRYRQEAAYVAALFARLDDVVVSRPDVSVEFRSTVVSDRGAASAESIWGADFGLTASLRSGSDQIDKGVLGQAKRHSLIALPNREKEFFREQVGKMAAATSSTLGLEVPMSVGVIPSVRIVEATSTYGDTWAAQSPLGRRERYETAINPPIESAEPAVLLWPAISLDKYLYDYLVGCLHGDRDQGFVAALDDSRLSKLHIQVERALGRER
jgi:hypothetical protein